MEDNQEQKQVTVEPDDGLKSESLDALTEVKGDVHNLDNLSSHGYIELPPIEFDMAKVYTSCEKDAPFYYVRITGGDSDIFPHGLSLANQFEREEDAVDYATQVNTYLKSIFSPDWQNDELDTMEKELVEEIQSWKDGWHTDNHKLEDKPTGLPSLCACLGPQFNEPVCPCILQVQGLPPSKERLEREAYLASPEGQAEQALLWKQFDEGVRNMFPKEEK